MKKTILGTEKCKFDMKCTIGSPFCRECKNHIFSEYERDDWGDIHYTIIDCKLLTSAEDNKQISDIYSDYQKALHTLETYFKNRQEPNQIGVFEDGLKNEIYFALRLEIDKLKEEYGFSNTKINVGGFPQAFTEMLADSVMDAIYEKYRDKNGKVSTMDAFFKQRRI